MGQVEKEKKKIVSGTISARLELERSQKIQKIIFKKLKKRHSRFISS